MSVILIFLALTLLIAGAWRGISVLVLAPVLATLAAFASGAPVLAGYTQIFMQAAGAFVIAFFPLFLLGALFGKVMEASGAAARLASAIASALGAKNAILAVVLACALLTYGGVSLFVVAFAAWPLAHALFVQTGLPQRLIPASIALGAFTFTMTALPGTPSIQNAIPMATFGTTAFAAPGLGLIAGAVMLGLGLVWLQWRVRKLAGHHVAAATNTPTTSGALPLWRAAAPILSVGVVTLIMGSVVLPLLDTGYLADAAYGATNLSRLRGLWSVITALAVALILALILSRPPRVMQSLNDGAESALLPLFNTASLVGFGAVIATLPGFDVFRQSLDGLAGGNALILAGNIGQKPETRSTQGGTNITNFSLATSRPRLSEGRVLRDENGYRIMDTEWHRITCFNGLGKTVAEHCEKGMKVLVHGRIHYSKWIDSMGNDRYGCEIIAEKVDFLSRPKSAESENPELVDRDDEIPF